MVALGSEVWGGHVLEGSAAPYQSVLRSTAWRLGGVVVSTLCLLALALGRASRGNTLVAAAVVILDLAAPHRSLNDTAPRELLSYRSPLVAKIPHNDRLYVYDYYSVLGRAPSTLQQGGSWCRSR